MVTSRAMALVMMCRLPVASAGGISTVVDWKFAPMLQPRPQGVAQMQASRFCIESARIGLRPRVVRVQQLRGMRSWSWACDSTAMREGMTGTPDAVRVLLHDRARRPAGPGAGSSTPGDESGVFSMPSLVPQTPISASTLS